MLTQLSQQEGSELFMTYVGEMAIQGGYDAVQGWIDQLLEPNEKREIPLSSDTPAYLRSTPRVNISPFLPAAGDPFSNAHGFFPTQSTGLQPPPLATELPSLPPSSNQQEVLYLALFNQTASQRRLSVEYTVQFVGPPHAREWNVKCLGMLQSRRLPGIF